MTALTLPAMDDATWSRMSWHGRQNWLRTATAMRRQLTTQLAAGQRRLGDESLTDRLARLYPDDADLGETRLQEATMECEPKRRGRTTRRASKLTSGEVLAEVEALSEQGATAERISERLHISTASLANRMRRADRPELARTFERASGKARRAA